MAWQNAQACPGDAGKDEGQMPAPAEWCSGTAYASETYLVVEHHCAASQDRPGKHGAALLPPIIPDQRQRNGVDLVVLWPPRIDGWRPGRESHILKQGVEGFPI